MNKILSIFLILILAFGITGCNTPKHKYTDYSFDCFDTVTTIIGYEKNQKAFDQNCAKIKKWLLEYHKLYDIYNSYDGITNLFTLNNSQGKPVKVDSEIINLLEYAKDLYPKTNGKFNIAMGSVLSIWHDYRTFGKKYPDKAELPPKESLEKASLNTNITDIIIDKKQTTVNIKDTALTVDVGGIAKGYATQRVAEKMLKEGISGYLLNVGGNVKTVGKKSDNTAWAVGIENPDRESAEAYVVELKLNDDSALVTSGSYQRFYTVNGKNYNHIIDSKTLYPADNFASVSVITKDSALADALSTALFCLPHSEGLKLLKSFNNTEAVWITKNGEKLYSNGFKNYLVN